VSGFVDLARIGPCPHCGIDNGETAEVGTAPGIAGAVMVRHHDVPKDGDVNVCVRCGGVSLFTGVGRRKRLPLPSERLELLADDDIRAAVRAVHAASANGPAQ
jgi:hypothetical protein